MVSRRRLQHSALSELRPLDAPDDIGFPTGIRRAGHQGASKAAQRVDSINYELYSKMLSITAEFRDLITSVPNTI
jgi:hypothetical protein